MDATAALQALLLGIVEGATEFLPVSSTGHLILLVDLLGFAAPPGKVFEIVIQLGAILAILLLYARKLLGIAFGVFTDEAARRYARNILLAFLPAAVLGVTLHGFITEVLFDPYVVCIALILGGIVIIAIERSRPDPRIHKIEDMSPVDALLVGCAQALAMIPGTSRSGATIIGALLMGVDRRTAAEFSFILAIPTMLGATAVSLYKARDGLSTDGLGLVAIGFGAAFVVAFFTVRAVLAVIGRIGFTPFGWYRIALGVVMLGVLQVR